MSSDNRHVFDVAGGEEEAWRGGLCTSPSSFFPQQRRAFMATTTWARVSTVIHYHSNARQASQTPSGVPDSPDSLVMQQKPQQLDSLYLFFVATLFSLQDYEYFKQMMTRRSSHTQNWLLLCDADFTTKIHNVYFPPDNLVVFATVQNTQDPVSPKDVTLWEVYQPAPHLHHRITSIGQWTPFGGVGEPHSFTTPQRDGSIKISGIYGDVWDNLSAQLNFTYVIVIKRPSASSNSWDRYLKVFSPLAWMMVMVFMVVATFTLLLVKYCESQDLPITVSDIILSVIASVCYMGTNLQFFRLPGRMAFITILLTSVLLYNYYTSFLVSALTINKITLPFTDFQSMLKAGTHTFSFNGGGSLENYFRYANNPVWQRVWRDMILTNPKSLTTVDGLAQVLEGSHAFLINEIESNGRVWYIDQSQADLDENQRHL
ncbi:Glutamate receptor 1-like 6 [Homarus americanus]|uniref:Glutamate receptor 1-like 6 n=1 Tax=Homarus americanus TaxID=6706 RepID=A0A8J5MZC5_HOMAM|nr:Glutamate receptor 1-like 6 [Homarus americanus]